MLTGGTFWLEEEEGGGGGGGAEGGGRCDCMNGEGEEETTGMEARGGLGGRAGRTVAGLDWTLALIRFSISSMSDWEDWWRGIVSPCDIFSFLDFPGKCRNVICFEGRSEEREIRQDKNKRFFFFWKKVGVLLVR